MKRFTAPSEIDGWIVLVGIIIIAIVVGLGLAQ